jgi:hypothetical protein
MDRDADADDRGMAGSDLGCAADPRAELEVHDSRRRRTRLDRYPDVEHARRFDAFMQQERRRRRPRGADPGGGRNQRRRADRQCSPGAKERSEDFECGSPPQHTRRIGSKLEGCNGRCKPWTPVLAPLRAPGPGLRERPMGPGPRSGRAAAGESRSMETARRGHGARGTRGARWWQFSPVGLTFRPAPAAYAALVWCGLTCTDCHGGALRSGQGMFINWSSRRAVVLAAPSAACLSARARGSKSRR